MKIFLGLVGIMGAALLSGCGDSEASAEPTNPAESVEYTVTAAPIVTERVCSVPVYRSSDPTKEGRLLQYPKGLRGIDSTSHTRYRYCTGLVAGDTVTRVERQSD